MKFLSSNPDVLAKAASAMAVLGATPQTAPPAGPQTASNLPEAKSAKLPQGFPTPGAPGIPTSRTNKAFESAYGCPEDPTSTCPTTTCSTFGQTCMSNSDCCKPYTCQMGSTGCGLCCNTANCGSDFDGCCSDSDCCDGYSCNMAQVNVTQYNSNPPAVGPFYENVCLPISSSSGCTSCT